jgi:hypothetical protein
MCAVRPRVCGPLRCRFGCQAGATLKPGRRSVSRFTARRHHRDLQLTQRAANESPNGCFAELPTSGLRRLVVIGNVFAQVPAPSLLPRLPGLSESLGSAHEGDQERDRRNSGNRAADERAKHQLALPETGIILAQRRTFLRPRIAPVYRAGKPKARLRGVGLGLVGPRRGGTLTRPLKALQSPAGRVRPPTLRALCAGGLIVNRHGFYLHVFRLG